jgi:hypothetical protein
VALTDPLIGATALRAQAVSELAGRSLPGCPGTGCAASGSILRAPIEVGHSVASGVGNLAQLLTAMQFKLESKGVCAGPGPE